VANRSRAARVRDPEATKRRILDAAETELATKGYEGARLRDIAAAAGVNHALVHHYFDNKEGLLRAVVGRAMLGVSTRAFEVLGSARTLDDLVARYVDVAVDHFAHNRNLIHILHFATQEPGSPAYEICAELGRRIAHPLLDATASALADGQRRGEVRDDVDARRLVVLAMGAVAFVFHEHAFFTEFLGKDVRSPASIAEQKRAAAAILRGGMLVPRE
jgi:TetR/AcrR family transcriptional regulator